MLGLEGLRSIPFIESSQAKQLLQGRRVRRDALPSEKRCEAKKTLSVAPPNGTNRLFSKIQLRGFKRSLISAARPNKSGGSEGKVNKILEISV